MQKQDLVLNVTREVLLSLAAVDQKHATALRRVSELIDKYPGDRRFNLNLALTILSVARHDASALGRDLPHYKATDAALAALRSARSSLLFDAPYEDANTLLHAGWALAYTSQHRFEGGVMNSSPATLGE